jgi:CRISPR-associated protein Csy1
MKEVINKFLQERKDDWLKKRVKTNMSEEEKSELKAEADLKFSESVWIHDASKRAQQLTLSSHPSKFSHTGSKTSAVIANSQQKNDGYLRTGNCDVELDVYGNAAALDVYKFLSLRGSDGYTVLSHIENSTELAKVNIKSSEANFEELRDNFLAIKQDDKETFTSDLVKQVYFPITKNEYHLLSVLSPSPIMFELSKRIREIKFSEETKQSREKRKKNEICETGFNDLYNLSMIGYGGTKPQNVSVLNSLNAGKSYLLNSLPPNLAKRNFRLPKYDFFKNSLWNQNFKEEFHSLHIVMKSEINTFKIRDTRENIVLAIAGKVLNEIWQIRTHEEAWSESEVYKSLAEHHKILLDNKYQDLRESSSSWLEKIAHDFALWFRSSYEKLNDKKGKTLADEELIYIKKLIIDTEVFR